MEDIKNIKESSKEILGEKVKTTINKFSEIVKEEKNIISYYEILEDDSIYFEPAPSISSRHFLYMLKLLAGEFKENKITAEIDEIEIQMKKRQKIINKNNQIPLKKRNFYY